MKQIKINCVNFKINNTIMNILSLIKQQKKILIMLVLFIFFFKILQNFILPWLIQLTSILVWICYKLFIILCALHLIVFIRKRIIQIKIQYNSQYKNKSSINFKFRFPKIFNYFKLNSIFNAFGLKITFNQREQTEQTQQKIIQQKNINEQLINNTSYNHIRNKIIKPLKNLSYEKNKALKGAFQKWEHNNNQINNFKDKVNSLGKIKEQQLNTINFKQQYKPIQVKQVKYTQIQQIQSQLKQQIQEQIKQSPQIEKELTKITNINQQQHQNKQKIIKNNIFKFIIQIVTAVKIWGKANHSQIEGQNIVNILRKYFSSYFQNMENKDQIYTTCYYLNDYMANKQQYTQKVDHKGCQNNMQTKLMNHFNYQINVYKKQNLLKNNPMYQSLMKLIDGSFHQMKVQAAKYYINLQFTQASDMLMRTLINYAVIYSLCLYYKFDNFTVFTSSQCSQLGPFCRQQGKFANQLNCAILQQIKNKYNQVNIAMIQQNSQNQLAKKKIQQQLLKKIQKSNNKQLSYLTKIQIQFGKIKQIFDEKGNAQRLINIMLEQKSNYQKKLKEIDEISEINKKSEKLQQILNHRYVKSIKQWQ